MSQPPRRPEREAEHGRRHAERDDVGQRVEIGAEHRLPPAVEPRHVAVEHVEDQRQRQQEERRPENRGFWSARKSRHRKIAIVPHAALPMVSASAQV